jgi:hypothetical protein
VFEATTQYGDWTGTAQADGGDFRGVHEKLEEGGWLEEGDFIVGIRVYMGEHLLGEPTPPIWVHFLVVRAPNFEAARTILHSPEPIQGARQITVEWSIEEFFRCFKRFSLALGWQDLPVVGREFAGITL